MKLFRKASELAIEHFPHKAGAFYGSANGLSLGVGLIYDCIRYPLLDEESQLFDAVEGLVYVLTHECDVDPANDRHFNEYVLICPIIKFEEWSTELASTKSEDELFGFIPDLVSGKIFRACYLPPVNDKTLPFGGILYFNNICSTHRKFFLNTNANAICALSGYAQQIIDYRLQNHLLRPKVEQLPQLR
jgi:hypothetical protein